MLEGSCLCGGIRYRVTGKLGPAAYCHCKMCQRANGSAFAANAPARTHYFAVTRWSRAPHRVRVVAREVPRVLPSLRLADLQPATSMSPTFGGCASEPSTRTPSAVRLRTSG